MRRYGNTISYSTEVGVDVDLEIDEFFDHISDEELREEVERREYPSIITESSLSLTDAKIEDIGEKLLKWIPRDLRYLMEYVTLRNQALVIEDIKKALGQV